jgi:predicted lipoprotein with Yx(FWY)xxD motif
MRTKIPALVLGVSAVFALSACSLINLTPKNGTANPPAASAAPAASAPAAQAAATGPGLRVAQSALGKIVTNAKAFTLYRFEKDSPKPSKPTCYGECAKKWPAYKWSADLTVEGIDQKLIGKVERTDGISQVTINGWPVYLYAGDTEAGQTNGHGVGGTWYAVTAEGKKASAPAASASASRY